MEDETAGTPEIVQARRQIYNLMPLSHDPGFIMPKMRAQACQIFNALPKDGTPYKAVFKIVRSRQDKQKYERHVLRAEQYLRDHPTPLEGFGDAMADYYDDKGWKYPSDVVKVHMITIHTLRFNTYISPSTSHVYTRRRAYTHTSQYTRAC